MTPGISHHLRLLSVLGALGVVYIHATTSRYDPVAPPLIAELQGYLSHNLLHSALSLFAFTSAYLLFIRQGRILRQLWRLTLPYLLWSGIWLGLALAISRPEPILPRLFLDPIPGQLWFLRDLLVMTALAPLIRRLPGSVLAAFAAAAVMWWLLWPSPTVIELRMAGLQALVSNQVLSAYLCGVLAARAEPQALEQWLHRLPSVIVVMAAAIWLAAPFFPVQPTICMGAGALAALLALRPLSGLAAQSWVARLAPYGFVIYLAHHPLIALLNGALMMHAGGSVAVHLATYALIPLLLILCLLGVFAILSRGAPRLADLLSGGRLRPRLRHV